MPFAGGFRIGRVAGIEIALDWSLLIIFALITVMLALEVFPAWHPGWSGNVVWGTALAAAFLFFLSILLHELSHALVGRAVGVTIRRITLFIFGGMGEMENEPPNWRAELFMALAGPLTSIALGVVFFLLAVSAGASQRSVTDPLRTMAHLSPLPTLLLWLAPVNIILGLFNLVPGFPLDGGRALRAVMWALTRNLLTATRWASHAGQGFAWLLMAVGLGMIFGLYLPILGGGLINGLWLAFVGWFLNNAALSSYRQLLIRETLDRITVSRLMQTRFQIVPPDMTVGTLVDTILAASGQQVFPVESDGHLKGVVFIKDLQRLERAAWDRIPVGEVMVPTDALITAKPDDPAMTAFMVLGHHGINQLAVIQDDKLVGLLRRQDILNWLALNAARPENRDDVTKSRRP